LKVLFRTPSVLSSIVSYSSRIIEEIISV